MEQALKILEFPAVLELIARCAASEPGAEKVKSLLPKSDPELVNLELNRVAEMEALMEEGETVPLKDIHDLRQLLKTASVAGAMLNAEVLLKVAATLCCARLVKKFLAGRAGKAKFLAKMTASMSSFEELENAVRHAIDETGEIRDSASPELKRIRSTIASEKLHARAALGRIMKQWNSSGFLREEIIASREGRLTLPVKDSSKNSVKGVLVDQSASGSTVFVEPLETVEINNIIRRLELEERREIERILREITGIVHKHRFQIEETYNILLEIDSVFARADYAQRYGCSRPKISPDNYLKIVNGRHPLLLIKEKEVVPLNLELPEGIRTLVISGPNAGGKTVALKTVGVLTLMAASGCFVPAGLDTALPLPTEVYAVIGDDQSIAADLSTFSAHLSKLAKVAGSNTQRKLVVIDEIMSGTDPAEGTALAISLLEKLTAEGALTIVTTHKGDLKAYAHQAEGVMNGSLEFDLETLSPTFRFLPGIPGSSYAFALAQKVGLPQRVIERAESLRGEDRGAMEKLLVELQGRLSAIEREKTTTASERLRAESLRRQLEDKLKNVKSLESKMRSHAEAEAEKILADANRAVEEAIRLVKKSAASKEAIKEAHSIVDSARDSFQRKHRHKKPRSTKRVQIPVQVGDRVELEESDVIGKVVGGKDKKGRFLVEAGNVKIRLPEEKLNKLPAVKGKSQKGKVDVRLSYSASTINPELDLRGYDRQQAVSLLEEYLNHAANANYERVDIIHGKGSGVLRSAVKDFLGKSSFVRSFRLGEVGEGDAGVTIVELEV